MKRIYLVTGNAGKLKEWQRMFPAGYNLQSADIDLDEIQTLNLEEIIKDKAQKAYDIVGQPVIVEDVSASLDELNGLPGPFIKYFEQALGSDALHQIARGENKEATVTVVVDCYDGANHVIARADIHGHVVSARGANGFGFDTCFMPDGYNKTFAEMTPAEKDMISHRSQAIKKLVIKLEANT